MIINSIFLRVFLSILIFLILTNGIGSSLLNICEFYYSDDKKKLESFSLYVWVSNLLNCSVVKNLSIIFGVDTGYGFFAPNVSSDFLVKVDIKDKCNNTIQTGFIDEMFNFQTKEAYIRFYGYTKNFIEFMKKDPDKILIKENEVYLKQLCRTLYYMNDTTMVNQMKVYVYLYDYPNLNLFSKETINLYEVNSIVVSKNSLQKRIK